MNEQTAVTAYIGLGGNEGDPRRAIGVAIESLNNDVLTEVTGVSSLYRTPPWGKTDQPDFLNAVVQVETTHAPTLLLELCQSVEHAFKRVRKERWGPRPIDVDILWYDGRNIDLPGLHIPHPRMLDRAFVLVPLAELAPNLVLEGKGALARAQALPADGITKVTTARNWWKSGD